jgi:hypothetical protein
MRESALNISIEMGDLVRGKLREAVGSFGRSAFQEPRRCEAILRDSCPEAPREVFLLVSALRENVAMELESGSATMPESALTAKLTRRLSENLGLSADAARWAVESWRYALDDNPGLLGDGRGTRSTPMADSDPGFGPRGATSEHPASTVNWPWLGMCFVALTSAAAALAAVGWLTFVHPWSTWPGGLLECTALAAVLGASRFGQLLCARSFTQMTPPSHQSPDPEKVAFALLPEVLVLVLMPLVPVLLPAAWGLEWWLELHVVGAPHGAAFHVIRSLESLCLAAFVYYWVRSLTSIQGSIACSMLRRR